MNAENLSISSESQSTEKAQSALSSVPSRGQLNRELVVFACAVVAVATAYIFYTGHIWEDYFITFRHSRNLAQGHGLAYTPGERVHGFTSPLGTLLPALFDWLAGSESYLPALWMFRVVSIAALAGGGIFLLKAMQAEDSGRNRLARLFFGIFYVFAINLVAYSTNGMESGFLLLFVGWAVSLLVRGIADCWLALGVAWAGLMWTRPDGCMYVAALALAGFFFRRTPWRGYLGGVVRAAGVCTLLYLPWFLWAWWYYGSPVPHTAVAKANVQVSFLMHCRLVLESLHRSFFHVASESFMPINAFFDYNSWHVGMPEISRNLGWYSALYWLLPTKDRLGRMASFCFALICLYLSFVTIMAWYLPALTMLGFVVLARGLALLAERWWAVAVTLLVILAAERIHLFAQNAQQLRIQQREIEWGTRAPIGRWLREHGRPEDRVFLEPIGYIGYFSGLRITDYPGLVCPEVVAVRRSGQRSYSSIISALRPEWLVLRPLELDEDVALNEELARQQDYELVKVFDARPRLKQYSKLPGKGYLEHDAVFLIFHRKDLGHLPREPNEFGEGEKP